MAPEPQPGIKWPSGCQRLTEWLSCQQEKNDGISRQLTVPTTGMAKGLGSTGGATMQRSKLSLKQESKQFDAKTDDGSGGGVGGKGIFNGGGGDNDDGDGDDYFDEFGDGDEGDGDSSFFRTVVVAENYSRCAPEPLPVSFHTVSPEASVPPGGVCLCTCQHWDSASCTVLPDACHHAWCCAC